MKSNRINALYLGQILLLVLSFNAHALGKPKLSALCEIDGQQLGEVPLWERDDVIAGGEKDGVEVVLDGTSQKVVKLLLKDKATGNSSETKFSRYVAIEEIGITLTVGQKKTVLSCSVK